MKKLIVLTFCIISFIACDKKQEEVKEKVVVEEVKEDSKLKVEINYKVDKSDIIQVSFNKIELDGSQEGNFIITNKVQASEELKNETYEMFGDYVNTIIQIKLGKLPKTVVIENILITYEDQKVVINGAELDRYFAMNSYITYNKENKSIVTNSVKNKHTPILTLRQGFIKRLFKLK